MAWSSKELAADTSKPAEPSAQMEGLVRQLPQQLRRECEAWSEEPAVGPLALRSRVAVLQSASASRRAKRHRQAVSRPLIVEFAYVTYFAVLEY